MIGLLRSVMKTTYAVLERYPKLERLKPAIDAMDELFFSTPLTTTQPPHAQDHMDIKRLMIFVVLTVAPCAMAGIYFFGWRVLALIIVSYTFGLLTETIFSVVRRETLSEGAFVTCILYPMTLPPTLPLWMAAVGIVVGITFGKEVFGGTGKNFFNPALVGRVFVAICFPVEMTTVWQEPMRGGLGALTRWSIDGVTAATPLIAYKGSQVMPPYMDLLMGGVAGSVGEGCKLIIIVAGIFLCVTKIANWRIPVTYIGTVIILSAAFHHMWPAKFAPPLFTILSGGLLFGAVYMATDPVSAPATRAGTWVYAFLIGFLTVIIRGLSGYVESVMFAILFMNIFAPLIDEVVLMIKYRGTYVAGA